ncbi:MAG: UvrD-helicase domain-containing protein [Lachnospiraceae bacterium]|nr:UvrD-helicase domain-containing protein [Lachnospiraceae bacterium]
MNVVRFDNATEEQKQIIESTEGYQRCAAVPGSGKTFVLTRRIAYLITQLYIEPASIVGLTFTNKAAASMKKRLKDLIGDEAGCFMGTFHGFCNTVLKEDIHKLSWPKTFAILDKADQIDLIKEVADELGLTLKDITAADYMEKISLYKIKPGYIQYMIGEDKEKLLHALSQAHCDEKRMIYSYMLKQRDNYVLDFGDLIHFTNYILMKHKDILEKWQDRCQYVLCDEYQDVNEEQELLLSLISGKFENLFVVGDDDQNIYGWRGSKSDYMIHFDEKYEDTILFQLTENFRSTPEIIDVAKSLISTNQNRLEKEMFTHNPHGVKPLYHEAESQKLEAFWIAGQIRDDVQKGKSYKDHAILVRAASQTRALEEAFIAKKLPYKILSGAKFYSSEEIRTTLSYLRMIYSLSDMDFIFTINRPKRKFGKKSLQDLREEAKRRGLSMFETLGQLISEGKITKLPLIHYYTEIKKLHESHKQHTAKQLVNLVLDIGYRRELQEDINQSKLDNVSELVQHIGYLEEENGDTLPLTELLSHFALFSEQDDMDEDNVIKIMTIHTAKGLEFPVVFVNGLVDGQFPSKKLRNSDEMEEERRLLYVAITRAEEMLYLSGYRNKALDYPCTQSCFLGDIRPDLLDYTEGSYIHLSNTFTEVLPKASFAVGTKVLHNVFGQGIVVGVDDARQIYEVDFEKIKGTRRVQFRAGMIAL